MNERFSDAPALSGGPSILVRPLSVSRYSRSFQLEVLATDLVQLVTGPDAADRLRTGRGYLHDTPQTLALERLLRESPEEFGLVGSIVLGADVVVPARSGGGFSDHLWLHGVELFDGLQRLRTVALVWDELGPTHLARTLLKVEVFCGAERERARRLHGCADQLRNVRDAQDRLHLCPHIRRLMNADWERWTFSVRRGMAQGPGGRTYSLPEVTRALACLSGPGPEIAHQVVGAEGLLALWEDIRSPSYLALFHPHMTPLGVMRAVETLRAAQEALDAIPKSRQQGHGKLIRYAPELIHWASCRFLPLSRLHDESFDFDWHGALRRDMRKHTETAVAELVRRYEQLVPPKKGGATYWRTAPELWLWKALTERI
ncbi:hypothetical protein [Streptomyces sp. V2I9]|uniref:hypothetical protein n=1 Tax=Streptomyces sp. V2I9 TaxID=3042304 RepID=UPI002785D5FD|nr:hypothetical protein [Streptomyces sp. V2I9]MDQ0985483.1 hypothetical protein [Streptomyces sp. V2I9]